MRLNISLYAIAVAFCMLLVVSLKGETIKGTFHYTDQGISGEVPKPIALAKVEIWSFAPRGTLIWTWGVDATVNTDLQGKISVNIPFKTQGVIYGLRILASNHACYVAPSNNIGTFYANPIKDGKELTLKATSHTDVLDFSCTFTSPEVSGYFNICETLRHGYNYVAALRAPGETDKINQVGVYWTILDNSFYNPATNNLEIKKELSFQDYGLLHEYSHFVTAQISSFAWIASKHSGCNPDIDGVIFGNDSEATNPTFHKDLMKAKHAWMEGFADFFACAVARKHLKGTFVGNLGTSTAEDIESPSCAAPSEKIENVVAAVLWDLVDKPSDLGSTAEPFDKMNDKDKEVFAIFDKELDVHGLWPRLELFCNAWYARGYDPTGLNDILKAYQVIATPSFPNKGKLLSTYQNHDGRIEVFYIGLDGHIYHTWQLSPGGEWSKSHLLGDITNYAKMLTVAKNSDGRLEVFYIGTDDRIYHNWQVTAGGAWSAIQLLGSETNYAKTFSVGQNKDGRLEVFYIGTDNRIYHNWQVPTAGAWSAIQLLGSVTNYAKTLSVGQNKDGRLEVFYIGTDDRIYHNWQEPAVGTWSALQLLSSGTNYAKMLSVGQNKDGRLEVFYIGTDDRIYHNWQVTPGGVWNGQKDL
ncbi:hypothetical protein [Haliscomenobacter hydrossis]|uniref:PLL-like beta propeller domain-containing protein n=1 Tax=Haliscomenobacter hydrossis (strain ATCC 27775 / DSM 1100 / LMG 10767 / O) TaxID=760192 RepID=F4L7V9_HALH1|nr:hypothetical protein [Haliscomenobacter hydrossis]AEE54467.1 hypothetical protein Halhy_6651 [Haliscomenobacter hydrossis DSM 1100]